MLAREAVQGNWVQRTYPKAVLLAREVVQELRKALSGALAALEPDTRRVLALRFGLMRTSGLILCYDEVSISMESRFITFLYFTPTILTFSPQRGLTISPIIPGGTIME